MPKVGDAQNAEKTPSSKKTRLKRLWKPLILLLSVGALVLSGLVVAGVLGKGGPKGEQGGQGEEGVPGENGRTGVVREQVDLWNDGATDTFYPVIISNDATGLTEGFSSGPSLRPICFEVAHAVVKSFRTESVNNNNNHYLKVEAMAGAQTDAGRYCHIVSYFADKNDTASYCVLKEKNSNNIVLYLRGRQRYVITSRGGKIDQTNKSGTNPEYPTITDADIEDYTLNAGTPTTELTWFSFQYKNYTAVAAGKKLIKLESGIYDLINGDDYRSTQQSQI